MTKIEWTDESWNPIIGCSKISPGCKNCYAERMANRLANIPQTNEYSQVITGGKWNGDLIFQYHQLEKPLYWKKPRKIFVCSMGDLFHENMPFEWIDHVFSITQKTPRHIYQVLTKRPDIMNMYFTSRGIEKPYLNVWLGVSVEDQFTANTRIPSLLQTSSKIHFVSCEPLLGKVSLDVLHYENLVNINAFTGKFGVTYPLKGSLYSDLDWVIVGGESGLNARPMHPDWVRSIRDQCKNSGTPFFFKQWGSWLPTNLTRTWKHNQQFICENGNDYIIDQTAVVVEKSNKKQTGHLLDGKEHRAFPKFNPVNHVNHV